MFINFDIGSRSSRWRLEAKVLRRIKIWCIQVARPRWHRLATTNRCCQETLSSITVAWQGHPNDIWY